MTKQFKYHSTNQFRNVVKTIRDRAYFEGVDEEGNAVINTLNKVPTVEYFGTVKLHGTNASVVFHQTGLITLHSKNNLLGEISVEGEFTLYNDNAEFAQTMYRRLKSIRELQNLLENHCKPSDNMYPLKVSGEWAGNGIQKGVGISQLEQKGFFIFGIKQGVHGWMKTQDLPKLEEYHSKGIYSIVDFKNYKLSIDFSNPEYSQNELVKLTEEVENCCPVSEQLGMVNSEGKPSLLGEGIVWTPCDANLVKDTGTWFKTKGQKHSVSKTKSVAPIDVDKLNSIKEFVEYSVTENRLQQGLGEVGLDQKLIGKFIGWVNKDINKEEGDTLESNKLSMKEVGKFCASKSREFYLTKLNTL